MVVYIDVLFLVNLTFDLLAIYLTAAFTESRLYPFWALTGCVIGSFFGVWALLFCRYTTTVFLLAPLILMVEIALSFKLYTLKSLLRLSVVTFFMTVLTGSFAYMVLRFAIRRFGIVKEAQSDGKVLLFSLISIFTGVILSTSSGLLKRQRNRKSVSVSVTFDGQNACCRCMVDSGNLLRDPTDGEAVIFFPSFILSGKIPGKDLAILREGKTEEIVCLSSEMKRRVRLVPGRTIDEQTIFLCFRPDRVIVDGLEKKAIVSVMRSSDERGDGVCPLSIII